MNRFIISIATAAAIFTTAPAHAAEVELSREIQGASIHENGVDMVVYYTRAGALLEVVATYVEDGDARNPSRLRMGMADGDKVKFALPGREGLNYAFSRNGASVRVVTEPVSEPIEIARSAD